MGGCPWYADGKRRQYGGTEKLNFAFNDSRTHAGYTLYTTGNGRFVTDHTVTSNEVFLQEQKGGRHGYFY